MELFNETDKREKLEHEPKPFSKSNRREVFISQEEKKLKDQLQMQDRELQNLKTQLKQFQNSMSCMNLSLITYFISHCKKS